ncbi:MAG: hypothetical protein Q7I97_03765 [Thermovirgaceae bacterium]|nr:hypothetical protein [Thermovirgaceae bacterium]
MRCRVCQAIAVVTLGSLFLGFSGAALAISPLNMEKIWKNNGAVEGIQEFRFGLVDWTGLTVSVEGVAPLKGALPSARLLGQRAALTDARRNLLLLLYELRFGLPEKLESIEVSGRIAEAHIDFERVKDENYIVGLTLPLEKLLDECVIFGAVVR